MDERYSEPCPPAQCEASDVIVSATITDRLKTRKRRLELELKEVNEALDGLNANPEIMRVFNLVSKAIGRSL